MESKYFYFDLDYYGVGFYEEEIKTESQQRTTSGASRRCFGRGGRVLHELGGKDHTNPEYDHYYNRETNKKQGSLNEPGWRSMEGPGKAAGGVSHHSSKKHTKHHKFTYGQVCELERVFRETQYPDALRRKALAQLINVDERKVKAWFKNQRAKYRKRQTELLLSSDTSDTMTNFSPKMDEDSDSTSDPEEPQGFLLCQQHLGQSCW
ncbi:rhox homeobox family member 1-like [Peromyscus eremicus]|uniref:rhox homeobox family member 1-like n=1 Tax=Peromyscus eremicus TaxID=42410 RepID=UPI0027DB5180|nr:rhox homeobox family member 1-like [Peromyscus eremicus]